MGSGERHAAALTAIDLAEKDARAILVTAQQVQLTLSEPKLLGTFQPGWGAWPAVEKVLWLRLAGLEGRRRILDRHAPDRIGNCSRCVDVDEEAGPYAGQEFVNAVTFPCPDWLDAAAGLEVPGA